MTEESSEESLIELPVEGAGSAQRSSATAPPLPPSMMQGIAKLQPRIPAVGGPVRPTSALSPVASDRLWQEICWQHARRVHRHLRAPAAQVPSTAWRLPCDGPRSLPAVLIVMGRAVNHGMAGAGAPPKTTLTPTSEPSRGWEQSCITLLRSTGFFTHLQVSISCQLSRAAPHCAELGRRVCLTAGVAEPGAG